MSTIALRVTLSFGAATVLFWLWLELLPLKV